jgi:hypothetical protein
MYAFKDSHSTLQYAGDEADRRSVFRSFGMPYVTMRHEAELLRTG